MNYDKSKSNKRLQTLIFLAAVFISASTVDAALTEGLVPVIETPVVVAMLDAPTAAKGTGGLVVVVESRVKEPFVVHSYRVLLDGKTVLRKKAGKKGEDVISFDALPVGSHKIKVKALYTGSGYGVFDYHADYKYSADGEFALKIKEGRVITLKVVCDDRDGFLADLEKRPFVSFETGSYAASSVVAKKSVPAEAAAVKGVYTLEAGMVAGKYVTGLSVEKFDSKLKVHVVGDGTFNRYEAFRLNDPERIVVDIFGVKELIGNDSLKVRSPYLTKVRIGQHEDRARVVLDIPAKAPRKYLVESSTKGLSILLGKNVTSAGKRTFLSRRSGVTAEGNLITGLAVEDVKESVKLIISGEGTLDRYEAFQLEKPDRIVIDILGVKEVLETDSLNVQGSFLEKVRVGQHPDRARVVLDLKKGVSVDYKVTKSKTFLIVEVARKTKNQPQAGKP